MHIQFTSILNEILSLERLSKDDILLDIEVNYMYANIYFKYKMIAEILLFKLKLVKLLSLRTLIKIIKYYKI